MKKREVEGGMGGGGVATRAIMNPVEEGFAVAEREKGARV